MCVGGPLKSGVSSASPKDVCVGGGGSYFLTLVLPPSSLSFFITGTNVRAPSPPTLYLINVVSLSANYFILFILVSK